MPRGLISDTSSVVVFAPLYRCTLCMFGILHLIQKHLNCPGHIWNAAPAKRTHYWTHSCYPASNSKGWCFEILVNLCIAWNEYKQCSVPVQISRAPVPPFLSTVRESSFLCVLLSSKPQIVREQKWGFVIFNNPVRQKGKSHTDLLLFSRSELSRTFPVASVDEESRIEYTSSAQRVCLLLLILCLMPNSADL